MKTNKLVTIVSLLMVVLFAGCAKDDFDETFGVCPLVVSTDPANDETNVPLDKVITVTFNEQMNPATITQGAVTLEGANEISGAITYNPSNFTASFTPSQDLESSTTYTGRVKTSAKDLDGNALQEEYVWTFSTGETISPMVITTDPENNETGVVLNKIITATFSMTMNPATINGTTFTLNQGANVISGVVTYSGTTATFTPASNLNTDTVYTATITTEAENTEGIPLQNNYVWEFTTGALVAPTVISTDPENNETGVMLDKVITATFSMPMDPVTINGTTFTLNQGANVISGVVTYSGTTAFFTPVADLEDDTTYTATITTGAENLAGTPLVSDYIWEFTTGTSNGANPIDLASVERFGLISGVAVSNNAGPSEIHNLDVGVYPGFRTSITGFMDVDGGPGLIFNGDFYAADDAAPIPAMLLQAKNDLTAAYLVAEGATSPAPITVAGDIGGQTLAPGIYKSNSTLLIQNGNLTLDAQGDPNAYWIFQIASDFTTVGGAPFPSPSGGNIILSGGANADNVTWQVGSSAVIGDYTSFKGNVLALTSVTMNAFAQAEGRMLCSNGAVVLTSTNFIFKP